MLRTLQELFVDRTRQIDAFAKMLDARTPRRIMLMSAGAGMGKSWVLRRYMQLARDRGLPVAFFDFADGNAYDALALVTRSRDQLGPELFTRLNDAILGATTPQVKLDLANLPTEQVDINLSGATIGGPVTVNKGDINISGNWFNIQTNDPVIRRAIEDRINTVFFDILAEVSAQRRTAFLFDSYERLSDDGRDWQASPAHRWLADGLRARMRDGNLPNVVVVLAGRLVADFDVSWNDILGRMSLEPLGCDDVGTYLRERRGLSIITDTELARLCQAVGGNPSVLGIVGDNLEQANRPIADDEW